MKIPESRRALSVLLGLAAVLAGIAFAHPAATAETGTYREVDDDHVRFHVLVQAAYSSEVTASYMGNRSIPHEPAAGTPPAGDLLHGSYVMIHAFAQKWYDEYVVDRTTLYYGTPRGLHEVEAGSVLNATEARVLIPLDSSGRTDFFIDIPEGDERWMIIDVSGMKGSSVNCDGHAVSHGGVTDPLILNATSDGPTGPVAWEAPFGIAQCHDKRQVPGPLMGALLLAFAIVMAIVRARVGT